jgi:hypothetical protein
MSKMIIIDTFQKSIILEVLRKHKLRAVIDKISWDSKILFFFFFGGGGIQNKGSFEYNLMVYRIITKACTGRQVHDQEIECEFTLV